MDDKRSLEYIRNGNTQAFEDIVQRYYTTLCAFAVHIVKDRAEAEDIIQQLFAQMWIRRDQLKNVESIKDYLFISARNQSLTFLRNKKRREDRLKQISWGEDDISAYLIEEETYRLLLESIMLLPPRSAEVINLSLQGMKQEEIAEKMEISINTVKSLKYEAIKKLKTILGVWVLVFFQ